MKRLLAAIAVLTLCACGSTQTQSKASPTSAASAAVATPTPTPAPAIQVFKPGDQIQVSNEKLQTKLLLVVGQPHLIKPSQYDSDARNGEYLGIPLTVENQGSQPFSLSSMLGFDLRDQDGQGYNTTFLSSAPKAPDGEMAPTQKLAGTLVYDVAPGKVYQLLFKANFLASGQAIVNLGQF